MLLQDGVLYFGTDGNMIYALTAANGRTVWSQVADKVTETTTVIASPVALGDEVAFTTEAGEVFTVSVDGTRGWTKTIKGKLYSNPVVVNNLMVVSGMEMDHYLATFDVQGKQDWTYDPPKK
jgi:outer membrane protein assembly factor BamB